MTILQSLSALHCPSHDSTLFPNGRRFSHLFVPPLWNKQSKDFIRLRHETHQSQSTSRVFEVPILKRKSKEFLFSSLKRNFLVRAGNHSSEAKLDVHEVTDVDGVEPFRGKSGSVSFIGLTHQLVEEGKLVSAPFKESSGSLLWVFAPGALILSLLIPQFIAFAIDRLIEDEIVSEIVASITSEFVFYLGLAVFILITDHVQKPYLQFTAKRWSLITGLKGYLTSAFFTMGFKIFAPLFAVYVAWPTLGLPSLVSVAPFLLGCLVQFIFEKSLLKRGTSCWPLAPIIFEVYRLYQLTKAAHYVEKLMFAMRGLPSSAEVMERSGALVAMVVTFQALGVVCLWSLLTFLQRLFPSRPVAESY